MRLPEIKCVLAKVGNAVQVNDTMTKRTVVFEIPERKISDEWGEEKTIKKEIFEADVINEKIKSETLLSFVGCKIIVTHAYLNGFEYTNKENEKALGKSITITAIKSAL